MDELPNWRLPYFGDNYTGAYWSDGKFQRSVARGRKKPRSKVDVASQKHDRAIALSHNKWERRKADLDFIDSMEQIGGIVPHMLGLAVKYGNPVMESLVGGGENNLFTPWNMERQVNLIGVEHRGRLPPMQQAPMRPDDGYQTTSGIREFDSDANHGGAGMRERLSRIRNEKFKDYGVPRVSETYGVSEKLNSTVQQQQDNCQGCSQPGQNGRLYWNPYFSAKRRRRVHIG